ncbi:MAG TPA: cyclopropane-fatty-acyl-phospholipid synthase family protein [Myxococcales bacterium]|nr:cyclopropane-fatty-acyl-phospholipid synthase family protein [Myxococcales bacterium]
MLHHGAVRVAVAGGPWREFAGTFPGPRVAVRFSDTATFLSCVLDPELRFGEAYVDGRLEIVEGDLEGFLHLARLNTRAAAASNPFPRLLRGVRGVRSRVRSRGARDVRHAYDLKEELFQLLLDPDRQYSCAYFTTPEDSLEQAQERKKLRLAAKLFLRPGQRVLDIGSGWGGLGLYLANLERVDVDGVTLSQMQYDASVKRAAQAGLAGRVRFHLRDYLDVQGKYDRIVSVGMLEHLGGHQHGAYFGKIADLLSDDGVAVIHFIARYSGAAPVNPWLDRYIFPGGFLPSLKLVMDAVERTSLLVTDVEVMRLHYAETLKAWRKRLHANRARIREMYDDRFIRMWDFYLTACEMVFRTGQAMVLQLQLAKSQLALPLTRDYIREFEDSNHPRNALRITGTSD